MADQTQAPASQEVKTDAAAEPKFSQADLDRIVQERLNRDRAKFSDYEALRQKAVDYEKQQETLKQQELERKQEYDKIKQSWEQKENDYKSMLDKTRSEVQSERLNNALNQAILQKNAYPDAAQLLRSLAKYNEDGTITIRGKDANGMDTDLPVDKGVEQFLKERPYLVKGSQTSGAGTATAGNAGNTQDVDLLSQLQNARAAGDNKKANEIRMKIKAKHAAMGATGIL